jgi:hypothetical protein
MSSTAFSGYTAQVGVSSAGVRYPSPFFDIASTYLPRNTKEMFQWCKYYAAYDDIVSSVIRQLAAFPVTQVIFDEPNRQVRERYRRLFEDQLGLKSFCIEVGLDYYTFGNAYSSVLYPFRRYLVCPKKECGHRQDISRATYAWRNLKFYGACPGCKKDNVEFKLWDHFIPDKQGIKLWRWDPERIDVVATEGSASVKYYYTLEQRTVALIRDGDRHTLHNCPRAFIDAVRAGAPILMDQENVYHFKRPTRSDASMPGLGMSIVVGILKKLFYKNVLLKSQEALAHQHIVPLWIFFPQANANLNPFTDINLGNWRMRVEQEVKKWRRDPNYIPIMPIPIGHEVIGGDQAEAGIHQQLELVNKEIASGMNTPIELLYGGMSYSGASVSVRLKENDFASYQFELNRVIEHFIVRNICRFLGWKPIRTKLQTLKMADDVQQKAAAQQLQQLGVISRQTLLAMWGIDYDEDKDMREKEAKELAKEMEEQMRAQARAQAVYQETLQHAQIRQQLRMKKLEMEVMQELMNEGMTPDELTQQSQMVNQQGGYPVVDPSGNVPTGAEGGEEGGEGGGKGKGPPGAKGGAKGGKGGPQKQQMGGVTPEQLVSSLAQSIMSMPGDAQLQAMDLLSVQNPEVAQLVRGAMSGGGAKGGKPGKAQTTPKPGQVDMRPLPAQKPPRRAQAVA